MRSESSFSEMLWYDMFVDPFLAVDFDHRRLTPCKPVWSSTPTVSFFKTFLDYMTVDVLDRRKTDIILDADQGIETVDIKRSLMSSDVRDRF